jgi:hypothetical protein
VAGRKDASTGQVSLLCLQQLSHLERDEGW